MNELLPIIGKNYRDACMAEITKAGTQWDIGRNFPRKWTTYRKMGEDMVNRIEMDLHKAIRNLSQVYFAPLYNKNQTLRFS
jgi:hypothetical protein